MTDKFLKDQSKKGRRRRNVIVALLIFATLGYAVFTRAKARKSQLFLSEIRDSLEDKVDMEMHPEHLESPDSIADYLDLQLNVYRRDFQPSPQEKQEVEADLPEGEEYYSLIFEMHVDLAENCESISNAHFSMRLPDRIIDKMYKPEFFILGTSKDQSFNLDQAQNKVVAELMTPVAAKSEEELIDLLKGQGYTAGDYLMKISFNGEDHYIKYPSADIIYESIKKKQES